MPDRGAPAVCSECGGPLDGKTKTQVTCSQSCRQKRMRRLARERDRRKRESGLADIQRMGRAAAAQQPIEDVAHEVLAEELRPIIRERITGGVLQHLDRLVTLTPRALERLQEDLDADDENVRQRAYSLVLRYTMGNPSAAPPPVEQASQPVTVMFQLPRPGDAAVPPAAELPTDGTAVEVRTCMDCGKEKPASEFVAGSERCSSCYADIQAQVQARFQ